jgi:prepilin-type N-terminal cleavage/methylation domain-containing protein
MNKLLKKGFTLVELLIVIVIIGILATVVLAAINPIEQINKSKDTTKSADAIAIIGALDRYYAANANQANPWPWGGTAPTNGDTIDGVAWFDTTLAASGELKPEFFTRSTIPSFSIFIASNTPHICFNPDSTSMGNDSRFNADGSVCDPAAADCYYCLPK